MKSQAYDINPKRALPTVAYRDADLHQLELDRVWRGGWVWVGTADQVAEAGDHFPTVIGGQPVIVVRRQDGTLGAMSNLCGHRGTLLVDEPGNTKRFQCPYHAWTFRDDGGLMSVPYADRSEVDKDSHCLPNYLIGEWHGLIFISLSDKAPPLQDYFAHLDPIAEAAGIGELQHWTSERTSDVWEANWKLIISNAMESYHLFRVHPETLEPYTPTADAFYICGGAAGTATGGKGSGSNGDYTLFSLPPNFVGIVSGGSLLWQAVDPIDVTTTRIVTGGAFRQPSPGESKGVTRWLTKTASAAYLAAMPDFLPEDKAICERGQRGATGDFTPGTLVEAERVVSDFHAFLNQRLHNVDPPPIYVAPTVVL